ncbi:LuxR C-terminal-related transcriptional regulator [Alkalihalophilus lindianensis]|uniref:LuxR C-terminal-related transcriptional regulator n=1 Tax=Alkalihalophilus lindianensis TaxID=1630542 RepID=A0ABU3XEV5_9BACI|nr:LuxR C-terminal-related transcriptional regulator [Alkalihalophilus lindianensis]MDV2686425.1 LuxR C-terminal-related transcriptional regulator [Alkalihalophilus lindianensis]
MNSLTASQNLPHITLITTNRSLSPAIRRYFAASSQNVSITCLPQKQLISYIKEVPLDDNTLIVWMIDDTEMHLLGSILKNYEASIIPANMENIDQELKLAVLYYPYISLAFQDPLLKCVQKKVRKEDRPIFTHEPFTTFNQTEKAIVYYMYHGCSTEDIAKKAYISVHTVNNNIYNIKKKLKVTSKVGIIKKLFINTRHIS